MRHSWRKNQNTTQQTSPGGKPGVPEICGESGITYPGMSASSPDSHLAAGQGGAWSCQQLEMGRWDGVTSPFCPPVPWRGALLGWPRGARLVPSPRSPAGHPRPSPLSLLAQVPACAILPRDSCLFFFFLQQLSELNRFIFCPSQFALWWY